MKGETCMPSTPYIFLIAVILAIVPSLIIFKVFVDKLKNNPEESQSIMTKFMAGIALSEVIPILLIVYGFSHLEQVQDVNELLMPGMIIVLLMAFSIFFIFLQRSVNMDEKLKPTINQFAMISVAFCQSIPIVSIVAFFIMAP